MRAEFFTVEFLGEALPMRRLSALEELELPHRAAAVLPKLLKLLPDIGKAEAIAQNAALLSFALLDGPKDPEGILGELGLSEIAKLCQGYYTGSASQDFYEEG